MGGGGIFSELVFLCAYRVVSIDYLLLFCCIQLCCPNTPPCCLCISVYLSKILAPPLSLTVMVAHIHIYCSKLAVMNDYIYTHYRSSFKIQFSC